MNALLELLDIRPSERRRAGLLTLYSMLAVGGVVIAGGLASRTLFLSRLPRDAIALKFLLPPLAIAAAAALYGRLVGRVPTARLIVVSAFGFAIAALGLRAGVGAPFGDGLVYLCALFVAVEVVTALTMIQFWTLAGEVFDAREAKRLFGPVAAGGTLAAVAFSLGLAGAARALQPEDLLLAVAGSLILCGVLAAALGRDPHRPDAGAAPTSSPRDGRGALRSVLSHRLTRPIAGLVIAGAVASAVADYQLDLALQDHYGEDAQGMVTFLGILRGAAGIAALALQLFVARRLLGRVGLAGGLVVLPVLLLFGQGAIIVTGGALVAAALPRAADAALKFDLNNTSVNLLFMPLGSAERARAKLAIEGLLKPVVLSLTGAAFLAAGLLPELTPVHWAAPGAAVAALWLGLVRRSTGAYADELRAGLRQRRLGGDAVPITLRDETSRRTLQDALGASDPALVLQALGVVAGDRESLAVLRVDHLLDHDSADVRTRAIELMRPDDARAAAGRLADLLASDPSPRVAGAALVALASTGEADATGRVLEALASDHAGMRAAAVRAALLHLGLEGVLHAASVLRALFESEDSRQRQEAARVLGELGASSFYGPLEPLLDDPDPDVRREAVVAAGRLGAPALAGAVARRLDESRLVGEAQRALAACLEGRPAAVVDLLAEPGRPDARGPRLVPVLGAMGEAGGAALTELVTHADVRVRAEAAIALRHLGADPGRDRVAAARAREDLAACTSALLLRGLPARDDCLTRAAVAQRIGKNREVALNLVGVAHPGLPVDSVADALRHPGGRVRANALELLETFVPAADRPALTPLAELDLDALARRGGEVHGLLEPGPEAALERVAADPDPWLRACAVHDVGVLGEDPGGVVAKARDDADPLVREAAARAAGRLDPSAAPQEPTMAMTTLEKVLFLQSVPLFDGLPGDQIAQIAPIAEEVRVAPGETFIRTGDQGDCLYVVVDGTLRVHKPDEGEATAGPRAIIGELAVLSHRPRSADCVAESELLLLRIGKDAFWQVLEERPELSTRILRQVIQRYL